MSTPENKTTRRWVPSDIPREGAAEDITTVKSLLQNTWESALFYTTLGLMEKDGVASKEVYAEALKTGKVDLRVVINGYEYPATAFVQRWRAEFDHAVAQEARRIVEERLHPVLEGVLSRLDAVDRGVTGLLHDVFPGQIEDDE